MSRARALRTLLFAVTLAALCFLTSAAKVAGAGPAPNVELDTSQVVPRLLEDLTQKAVVRDYTLAWSNLADALSHNQPEFLSASFTGTAQKVLQDAIRDQKATGVRLHYRDQHHRLKATFYAPEGDVLELHDTVECDIQVTDGSATIHQEHAVLRYVVLMTPGADRWVIRQMQAVPGF